MRVGEKVISGNIKTTTFLS